jgi:hypothetical protein
MKIVFKKRLALLIDIGRLKSLDEIGKFIKKGD